jgi:hypothetical protein
MAGGVEALLTGGHPRSLHNAGTVVDVASRQPERLEELVQCVFSADEIVRMRASDALEKVCRSHPRLVQRFVPRLLAEMSPTEQASVQWHLAQILAEVPLDEEQQVQAIAIFEHNLDTSSDWIVTNCMLEALGVFARAAQLSGRGWSDGCTTTSTASTSRSRHERASCSPSSTGSPPQGHQQDPRHSKHRESPFRPRLSWSRRQLIESPPGFRGG